MLILQNPSPGKQTLDAEERCKGKRESFENVTVPIKTTLLVTTDFLIKQWKNEIRTHLKPGALSYGCVLSREEMLKIKSDEGSDGKALNVDINTAFHDGMKDSDTPMDLATEKVTHRTKRPKMNPRSAEECTKSESQKEGKDCQSHKASENNADRSERDSCRNFMRVLCRDANDNIVDINSLDIAFCSCEALESHTDQNLDANAAPLLQLKFWRVCLDAAHLEFFSRTVIKAIEIPRRHAWYVIVLKDFKEIRCRYCIACWSHGHDLLRFVGSLSLSKVFVRVSGLERGG